VCFAAQCVEAASTILLGAGDEEVWDWAREAHTGGQYSQPFGEVIRSSLVSSRGLHHKWEGGIT